MYPVVVSSIAVVRTKCAAILPLLVVIGLGHADSIDERLYTEIHHDWRSPMMDFVMESMSTIGSREVCLSILLGLSTFGDENARDAAKLSVVSLASGQIVCGLLKASVNRERPEGTDHSRWNSSFPSGHAAGAFSLASILSTRYPHFTVPFYTAATAIGISRVYLGSHYPSDVIAGALIGYVFSWLVLKYEAEILDFDGW